MLLNFVFCSPIRDRRQGTLIPGANVIQMKSSFQLTKVMTATEFYAQVGSLQLCSRTLPKCELVTQDPRKPSVVLGSRNAPLLVGMPQSVSICLKGVPRRARNVRLVLNCSNGLKMALNGGGGGGGGGDGYSSATGSDNHLLLSDATVNVAAGAVLGRADASEDLYVPIQLVAARDLNGSRGSRSESGSTSATAASLCAIERVLSCSVHFESLCASCVATADLSMHFYQPFAVDHNVRLTQNGLFATIRLESSVPCPITLRGRRLVPTAPSFVSLPSSLVGAPDNSGSSSGGGGGRSSGGGGGGGGGAGAGVGHASAVRTVRMSADEDDFNANLNLQVVLQPGQRLSLLWKLELEGSAPKTARAIPSTIYSCSCTLQLDYTVADESADANNTIANVNACTLSVPIEFQTHDTHYTTSLLPVITATNAGGNSNHVDGEIARCQVGQFAEFELKVQCTSLWSLNSGRDDGGGSSDASKGKQAVMSHSDASKGEQAGAGKCQGKRKEKSQNDKRDAARGSRCGGAGVGADLGAGAGAGAGGAGAPFIMSYSIVPDKKSWMIAGKIRDSFEPAFSEEACSDGAEDSAKDSASATETIFSTRVLLLPTCAGMIPLPNVNLYWRPNDKTEASAAGDGDAAAAAGGGNGRRAGLGVGVAAASQIEHPLHAEFLGKSLQVRVEPGVQHANPIHVSLY